MLPSIKVYLVFRGGGKPHDDAIGMGVKSSGTKFIHRSQARTFANASSVTTSTAQAGAHQGECLSFFSGKTFFPRLKGPLFSHSDARLTDQEALEEIKQLSQQLQRLYERIPPRGTAISTISALLDTCKGSNNSTSLKPPPLPAICNKPAVKHLDKGTNTNTMEGIDQVDCLNTSQTRITITDESIKVIENSDNSCNGINSNSNNKNNNYISFDNLQLKCMCADNDDDHLHSSTDGDPTETDHHHHTIDNNDDINCDNYDCKLREKQLNNLRNSLNNFMLNSESCDNLYNNKSRLGERRLNFNTNNKNNSNIKTHFNNNNSKKPNCLDINNSKNVNTNLNLDSVVNNKTNCSNSSKLLKLSKSDDNCLRNRDSSNMSDSTNNINVSSLNATTSNSLSTNSDSVIVVASSGDVASMETETDGTTASVSTATTAPASATPNSKRKKSPEKRLVLDLNDRSKYTEEVSV